MIRTAINQSAFMGLSHEMIKEIQTKMASATESTILQQINDFISRGLIVVEVMEPLMMLEPDSDQVVIRQSVRLVLKDKEYVEKLEVENKELKEKIKAIKDSLEIDL